MKFVADRGAFKAALDLVRGVIEKRNTIPILGHIKVEAADGRVTITGTDLDIEIRTSFEASVQRAGAACPPAFMLYDIVRKAPTDAVIFEKGDVRGTLSSGRARFQVPLLPQEDYPAFNNRGGTNTFTMKSADLLRAIQRTSMAMSTEETRYYLNGVYFEAGGKVLRAVATDGHRLVRYELTLPDGAAGMKGIIVPRKTIGEWQRVLGSAGGETDVTLTVGDTSVSLSFGDTHMISKLIDGTFPDYQRVIPQNGDKLTTFDTAALTSAIDRVSTVAAGGRVISLKSEPGGVAQLGAKVIDAGEASEDIDVEHDGAVIEVGFNGRYLTDIMRLMEGDKTRFTMVDAGSPAIIQNPANDDTLIVLMPMRF